MPLPSPILDDRSYQQLRDELVRRIPVYDPEWTDHNASDPGITLIELFAFLGENLLYRFNQIPETTKLAFLKLLQIPLRPAVPAQAMLALRYAARRTRGRLGPRSLGSEAVAGDVPFETLDEVTVAPWRGGAGPHRRAGPGPHPRSRGLRLRGGYRRARHRPRPGGLLPHRPATGRPLHARRGPGRLRRHRRRDPLDRGGRHARRRRRARLLEHFTEGH